MANVLLRICHAPFGRLAVCGAVSLPLASPETTGGNDSRDIRP
jgi:hypothetical protein